MRWWMFILAGAAAAALPAWAADGAVEGAPYHSPPAVSAPAPTDQSTLELTWDNGTRRWSVGWYTGAGSWVGNDFDSSTLKTSYVKILKFKMYTRNDWPNTTWDGFRIGFYSFGGGVPGSRLWPTSGSGYFFRPSSGTGHVWVECDINWTCPSVKFLAAQEQFYNWPNCDPWSVDNNPTFLRHSWNYYGGQWGPLSGVNITIGPYYNLMIRVLVETGVEYPGVLPSSIGRVKALYY
ncbi:MAG: hypothetical protein JSU81_09085 [Candidatus Coatesbacteria bacterium]|nr:MAG: hypothetical protein JSU81_09085 [Candidatus Coatesbacteria bacterium]